MLNHHIHLVTFSNSIFACTHNVKVLAIIFDQIAFVPIFASNDFAYICYDSLFTWALDTLCPFLSNF